MEAKPRSIELTSFREEMLPSSRKLLHCVFKDKFGLGRYVWTPPWKGDSGVERLFLKALDIEEWNDYDGAWSNELRQVAKCIPSLDDLKLPVKIQLGEMAELLLHRQDGSEEPSYRLTVNILSSEVRAWCEQAKDEWLVCIGDTKISWKSLAESLRKNARVRATSTAVETYSDWNEESRDWERLGVSLHLWVPIGFEKSEYQIIGREVMSHLRSLVRKRLSHHQALKRGFEEA